MKPESNGKTLPLPIAILMILLLIAVFGGLAWIVKGSMDNAAADALKLSAVRAGNIAAESNLLINEGRELNREWTRLQRAARAPANQQIHITAPDFQFTPAAPAAPVVGGRPLNMMDTRGTTGMAMSVGRGSPP